MKRGKIIAIEGSDFSGKATQKDLIYRRLKNEGVKVERDTFPKYESPTGRIIEGPLQGKQRYGESFFPEGPGNVPQEVAIHYYIADRVYNRHIMDEALENGDVLILDRYVDSNMAHQGGKISEPEKRKKFYKWLEDLEYNKANLPKPDMTLFLYVPFEKTLELKGSYTEESYDALEKDKKYLEQSINAYLQLAEMYDHWQKIDCVNEKGEMKSREEIHENVYKAVKDVL
ncbi:MAG: dTMP kinase [Candidatus Pacearchaeota archaeon]